MTKRSLINDMSVRVKLFATVSILVVGLVGFFVAYFPSRQINHLNRTLERKALSFSYILAFQVRSSVAFDDKETARESFEGAATDPDVSLLVLFDESGAVLQAQGKGEAGEAPPWSDTPRIEQRSEVVRVAQPVVSLEGPKGTLIVELSKSSIQAEASAVRRTALGIGLAVLLIGFLTAWAVGTSFGRRIARVADMAAVVARGDLSMPPLADTSRDEVGQLVGSFNTMLFSLRNLVGQIASASVQMHTAADGILGATRQQEQGAARQSGAADQGRATVEALMATSNEIVLATEDVLLKTQRNQEHAEVLLKGAVRNLLAEAKRAAAGDSAAGPEAALALQRSSDAAIAALEQGGEIAKEAMSSAQKIASLIEDQKEATGESRFVMDAVADVAEETVAVCEDVVASASELRGISASLKDLVGGFKLTRGVADTTESRETDQLQLAAARAA